MEDVKEAACGMPSFVNSLPAAHAMYADLVLIFMSFEFLCFLVSKGLSFDDVLLFL